MAAYAEGSTSCVTRVVGARTRCDEETRRCAIPGFQYDSTSRQLEWARGSVITSGARPTARALAEDPGLEGSPGVLDSGEGLVVEAAVDEGVPVPPSRACSSGSIARHAD
jgi:6-phosphogluconate dehydrogenase (decarboxylating)